MDIKSIFPFLSFNWADIIFYLFWAFLFFMVIREVLIWYWKLNKITDLSEKIEKNTNKNDSENKIADSLK